MPVASMLMSSLGGSGGGSGGSGGGGGGVGQAVANLQSGLLSGGVGYFQRRKAKKMLKNLQQPVYDIPNEVMENKRRAEIAANEGMPSQQYTNAMRNIRQNENDVLNASLDRRSALMALPKIQRQSNNATSNLDAQDAAMRTQNQRALYGINSQIAQYRDKAWDINKMQPYQRDYGYAMGLLGAGNQNLLSGADRLIAGGGQLIDSVSGGGGGGRKKQQQTPGAYGDGYSQEYGNSPYYQHLD
jgi:hypothetical protein